MIVSGVLTLLSSALGIFGQKGKAAQERITTRISAMERSWTDEVIAAVWFSPLIVSWFSPDRATSWIQTVTQDAEYYGMLVGITAAVFGLGKMNGRKGG